MLHTDNNHVNGEKKAIAQSELFVIKVHSLWRRDRGKTEKKMTQKKNGEIKCTKPNPRKRFQQTSRMAHSSNVHYMRQHPSNLFIIKKFREKKLPHCLFAIFAIFATEYHLSTMAFFVLCQLVFVSSLFHSLIC